MRRYLLSPVVLAVSASCALDWSVPTDAGVEKVDGATQPATDAGLPDVPSGPPDVPDATAPTPNACKSSDECGQSSVCIFDDFGCGSGAPGRCVPRDGQVDTSDCAPDRGVFCGCNGQRYSTPCLVLAAGVDLSKDGCASNDSTFGYASCESPNSGVLVHDPARSRLALYRCEPRPPECANDCVCLAQRLCKSTIAACEQDRITCQ